MENVLFLSSRYGDGASLVASSEVSTLPVANLQDRRPDKVWRATGCSAEYVTIDLGSAVACNALAVIWPADGPTGSATLRVRGAATSGDVTASPAVDTTAVSAWPGTGKPTDIDWPYYLSLVRWSNSSAYRYWRLDIADGTNPAGYAEAGRLLIGRYFQPGLNLNHELAIGLFSADAQVRTAFNSLYTNPRGVPGRRMSLPFGNMSRRDLMDSMFDLQRYCGLARDFVVSIDPSETTDFHRRSMQALFEQTAAYQAQPIFDGTAELWTLTIPLIEVV